MFRTDQDPAELGRKGVAERNRNLTPVERSAIAANAAYRRWHGRLGEDLARVGLMLRVLEQISASAQSKGNDKLAKRAASVIATCERLRIRYQQTSWGQSRGSTPKR